tara:strand:+ start:305 stop:700 length:396 start_codon:yes stop_codon:yes gene_type:complete
MNKKKEKDLLFGLTSEEVLLFRIKELFGKDVERTGLYDIFDYENENYQIELKTRRIVSKAFKDIMIGLNKLEIAETTKNKKSIFLWKMNDGLFMWEFNKNQYEVRMGGTQKRGLDERKFCGFVPTHYLKKV